MSDGSISDKLRWWADSAFVLSDAYEGLEAIADRIDSEMVELPKGSDGKPIIADDVVYGLDGAEFRVSEVVLIATGDYERKYSVNVIDEDGNKRGMKPEWLSHERQDSLERIANEIDGAKAWCDVDGKSPAPVSSISNETLHKWAERIRRLAEKEGE